MDDLNSEWPDSGMPQKDTVLLEAESFIKVVILPCAGHGYWGSLIVFEAQTKKVGEARSWWSRPRLFLTLRFSLFLGFSISHVSSGHVCASPAQ